MNTVSGNNLPVRSRVEDEASLVRLAGDWAGELRPGNVVYLTGELGAGKTTFVRGILSAMGHHGMVASPTYTIVEPYSLGEQQIFHLDLYRIQSPEELETIGIRDMLTPDSIALIEWPERGAGLLPRAHHEVHLEYAKPGRKVTVCSHAQTC